LETLPRLYLIRHGDTQWSQTGQHTGRTDIALLPVGEERAVGLIKRLEGVAFSHVFTSPLIRARRTCELAGYGERAEVNGDLVEWDYGDYEGMKSVDIKRGRPDWDLFRDGVPNGESPADVAARADRFVAAARKYGGNVAAFSSGHIIRMIAARWLGLPAAQSRVFYCTTASIGIMGYEHGLGQPVVHGWNEAGK
jgi:broad specificity phosphatase PhoE